MIVNINNKIINVDSSFDKVYDRLKQYEVNNTFTNNKLVIKENTISIIIDDIMININEKINTTDIYPVVNNVIAYCINDLNNLYIHSVVVSKNNKGIMILGEFNSGKSTLAKIFEKYGYEINSADQTWICKNKMVMGSRINVIDNKVYYVDAKYFNKNIKIDKIIILNGLCYNGDIKIEKIENDNYYIKNIFKYANWHYSMPLLTKYIKLIDTGESIIRFLRNTKISTYVVKGDGNKILEAIDDRKEGIE